MTAQWKLGDRIRLTGTICRGPAINGRLLVQLDGQISRIWVDPAHLVDASMPEDDPTSGHDDWGTG